MWEAYKLYDPYSTTEWICKYNRYHCANFHRWLNFGYAKTERFNFYPDDISESNWKNMLRKWLFNDFLNQN